MVVWFFYWHLMVPGCWWTPHTRGWVGVCATRISLYCWPMFKYIVDMSSDYLSTRRSHMYWNRSWHFSTTPRIHFSQALKIQTKTRPLSMNSLLWCWSCLIFATACFSYMHSCRFGCTIPSLTISFIFMNSSAGDISVVMCVVVGYCTSILHTHCLPV